MILTLLAIACADTDDQGRLERVLPEVNKAVEDLMRLTLCRLCG
ncbi:MAG: hypothetical protein ACK4TK_08770 [Thiobacillaceae bacterium]